MIDFVQIIECTVEHQPAGRRNGIDCGERNVRGLIGISRDGNLFRYDYINKTWQKQQVILI